MAVIGKIAAIGKVGDFFDSPLSANDNCGAVALGLGFPVVRSPLRYPGGKTRAVKVLSQYIPRGTKEVCSPFLGGGSFELALANQGIRVYAYDIFSPLINFWQHLLVNPKKLANNVCAYFPLAKQKFYNLQKSYFEIRCKAEQAAVFYTLNRASFSGTTLSGGMSPEHPRFTESSISTLRNFKIRNFQVEEADFETSISRHSSALLYCDPPYINGESLYGHRGDTHKGFDHERLRDILASHDKWILSYNDCEAVRELYADYKIIEPQWVYGMGNSKLSGEVLILSRDL